MIVYNVTIKVDTSVADEWVRWMNSEHIADVLATGSFTNCRLCRLLDQDETDGLTYTAQYDCVDMATYNHYIDIHAETLRTKANTRFAGKFVAFRTLMEVI